MTHSPSQSTELVARWHFLLQLLEVFDLAEEGREIDLYASEADNRAKLEQIKHLAKRKYRQLALATHPDRGGSAADFAVLARMVKVLQDFDLYPAAVPVPRPCPHCNGLGYVETS